MLLGSCMLPRPGGSGSGSGEGNDEGADFAPAADAEEILENIARSEEENDKNYDFVSSYLIDWGFPEFDKAKVNWIESKFYTYYNYEGGISASVSAVMPRAAEIARIFIDEHYSNIDLTKKDDVTAAIVDAYVTYSGDPYAVYRTGDEYNEFNTDMSGEFCGIGVMVEYDLVNVGYGGEIVFLIFLEHTHRQRVENLHSLNREHRRKSVCREYLSEL